MIGKVLGLYLMRYIKSVKSIIFLVSVTLSIAFNLNARESGISNDKNKATTVHDATPKTLFDPKLRNDTPITYYMLKEAFSLFFIGNTGNGFPRGFNAGDPLVYDEGSGHHLPNPDYYNKWFEFVKNREFVEKSDKWGTLDKLSFHLLMLDFGGVTPDSITKHLITGHSYHREIQDLYERNDNLKNEISALKEKIEVQNQKINMLTGHVSDLLTVLKENKNLQSRQKSKLR